LHSILIDLSQQTLVLQEPSGSTDYKISSAAAGIGQLKDSGQTPLGRHYVRAKIGAGCALNSVFVGRRPTGEIYTGELCKNYPDRDWILTRILWLCGLEVGFNRLGRVDSMQRYIYIHGTPDSEPMGKPRSHGCIRMQNQDIIQLFDRVSVGTEVLIAS